MRQRRGAAWALVVALAVLPACGGGGSSGPSKADFVAKGNELCRTLAGQYDEEIGKLGPNPTREQVAEVLRTSFVAEALSTYRSIAALGYPKADADKLDAIFRQTQAELFLIQSNPIAGGNAPNQRRLVAELHDYGLDQCGAGFASKVDKAQFVQEANSICDALGSSYHKAYADADATLASPPDQLKTLLHTRIVPLTREALTQIEAIGYEDATLASIIADTRKLLDEIDADPNRTTYGDTPEEHAINRRWVELGTSECGGQLAAAGAPGS